MKYFLVLLVLVSSCKEIKPAHKPGDPLEATDFLDLFPAVQLPFQVGDTLLRRRETDSIGIDQTVFTQFIPDTLLAREFGKSFPKIFPLGRINEKGKETYLFVKAIQGNKRAIYLVCFDNKNTFQNGLPLIRNNNENNSAAYGQLDKKYQITTYRERKLLNGETSYKRNVYIYNSGGNLFNLILTEPNEEMIDMLDNPIDTFPKKNKFSGDYLKNAKNIISIRDGRKPRELLFFVHFEKEKGTCMGELKGTARLSSAYIAEYKANGNPCTLEFIFGAAAVTLKETAGCGSYRDIKCFFEGTFPRKKMSKTKQKKT